MLFLSVNENTEKKMKKVAIVAKAVSACKINYNSP